MEAGAIGTRGVALVEQVIQGILDGPGDRHRPTLRRPATPVPEDELAGLTLVGGRPLPESLARWLRFDGWSMASLIGEPERPELRPMALRELIARAFGGFARDPAWAAFDELLPGACYLLPGGSDARRFLYVGEADAAGEYPVLCVDTHDIPFVCVYSPGFDVWLAEHFRRLPGYSRRTYTDMFDHPAYGAAMVEQARRNFGGFRALDQSGHDTSHLDGDAWLESTGVGSRAGQMRAAWQLGGPQPSDSDDEDTRPGDNPFTGRPWRGPRHGF